MGKEALIHYCLFQRTSPRRNVEVKTFCFSWRIVRASWAVHTFTTDLAFMSSTRSICNRWRREPHLKRLFFVQLLEDFIEAFCILCQSNIPGKPSKRKVRGFACRYSCRHAELMQRRIECRENILRKTIERLCKQRQRHLSEARKQVLLERTVVELVEFLSPKKPGNEKLGGRISGSLAWRLERGETTLNKASPVVIKPTTSEVACGILHLQYCCATNQYRRCVRVWCNWTWSFRSISASLF